MDLQIHIPKITIDDALGQAYPFIDVRSPKEFAEFHMPNAINIPVFSNEEREEVGTLYVQNGKHLALERGIQIFAKKLEVFYQEMKNIYEMHNCPLIVYCWRGGMRSKSVVSTMGTLGIPVIQLQGGIRSYRYLVTEVLKQEATYDKTFIVLEGLTGTRKTDMLVKLEKEGYPVIDIEKFANHRGSVFGQIGLEPNSQKQFDAFVFERIRALKNTDYYIVEAESKRVGRVILPEFIINGKDKGVRIHVDAPLSERITALMNIYPLEDHHEEIVGAFTSIERRIAGPLYKSILEALSKKDYEHAIAQILTEYYDPKYSFALDQYDTDVHYVFYDNFSHGYDQVKAELDKIIQSKNLKAATINKN